MKYILKELLSRNLYFKEFEQIQGRPVFTCNKENALSFDTEIEAISMKNRVTNTEVIEVK